MTQLSICIPNYNRIECLNDCLNSILISSQNVEILILKFVFLIITLIKILKL